MRHINDNAYVFGRVLAMYLSAIRQDEIRPYLEKYNLTDVQDNEWYPMQTSMQVFYDIEDDPFSTSNLVSWGILIGQLTSEAGGTLLPYLEFIANISQVYHNLHQGEVGDVVSIIHSPQHVEIISTTPYPDDLEYGIFYGQLKRLLPKGQSFVLSYDEAEARRAHGGSRTVFHVTIE